MLERKIKLGVDATVFLFAVILLQVFRRLNMPVYIAILLFAYLCWIKEMGIIRSQKIKTLGVCFIFLYLMLPIYSLFMVSLEEYGIAIVRYGALVPFIVFGILRNQYIYEKRDGILKVYCVIVFFSALLTLYQVFFGRIPFFVDTAGRLGYERYGSLLGSTTTYATASLVAIMAMYVYPLFTKGISRFFEIMIIVGGILCLSKAFFVNVAIVYVLIFFYLRKEKKVSRRSVVCFFSLICMGVIGGYFVFEYTIVGEYFDNMFSYTFSENELGLIKSIFDRLVELPKMAFEYHEKPWCYYILIGVGFKGHSGILGLAEYPMCHNNYFDLVLSQGIVFLCVLMAIYISTWIKAFGKKDRDSLFIKMIIPYILVNMLAGQWSYLTTIGSLFLVLIYAILNRKSKEMRDNERADG